MGLVLRKQARARVKLAPVGRALTNPEMANIRRWKRECVVFALPVFWRVSCSLLWFNLLLAFVAQCPADQQVMAKEDGSSAGLTVLRTESSVTLQTSVKALLIPDNVPGLELQFEFGFGTDELLSPGEIPDSFTVTLQDAPGANTVVLLTADAGGVIWAPPTPGGLFLAPETIARVPVSFPSLDPVLAQQTAYAVAVPVPLVFRGPVNLYFDLFDNLNATRSLGWHGEVTLVPEPRVCVTLCAGLVAVLLRRVLHNLN